MTPLLLFRHHRIRRVAFFWAAGSWFACPEWYRAYWRPSKSMVQLLNEQQNDGQKATTSTPPAPKSEQVAARQDKAAAASPAVLKSAPASTRVQVNKTAAPAGSTSVEEMRKRAADRLAEEQRRLDKEEQARQAVKKQSASVESKTTSTESSSASQSTSAAPTPIVDAMRKRAQARIAKELKAVELKDLAALAEETERARKAAQNPAVPVESKSKATKKGGSSKATPTPIVNEMRRRAAERLAKQQNRQ